MRKHLAQLVALLLVCSVVGPAVAGVAMGQASLQERSADLLVEQPHYISSDVAEQRTNGTRIYEAQGSALEVTPQNFAPEDVVDFGVTTDGGSMTYDQPAGEFDFSAGQQGTYSVYWIVAETMSTTTSGNASNGTANQTTTTTTQQVRYQASIRVTGGTNLTHISESSIAETRRKANLWEDANETIQELRNDNIWVSLGLQPPLSTEGTFQEMVNSYRLKNSPLQAITGDTLMYVILLVTGLGGIVLLLGLAAWHFGVVAWLTRRLAIFESVEKDEGDWARRVEQAELEQRQVAVANQPFQKIFGDDFIASAMAEEGRNPFQSFLKFWARNSERGRFKHRLQVMGQNGFVATTDDDVAADGGVHDGVVDTSTLEEVRVVREETLDEGAPVVPLDADHVDDDLVDAIPDWTADPIGGFDLASADWDESKIHLDEDEDVPATLTEWIEQSQVDRRHFTDEEEMAEQFVELLEHIRETSLCDDAGAVDGLRVWLEDNLDAAHVLNDRFELPVDYQIQALEAAIRQHDKRERAKETLDDVREGKFE